MGLAQASGVALRLVCLAGTVKISADEMLPGRLNVWIPFTIS